jgi:hypothetical protein
MKRGTTSAVAVACFCAAMQLTAVARAQSVDTAPSPAGSLAPLPPPPSAPPPPPLPDSPPPGSRGTEPPASAERGPPAGALERSDHDALVGHLAVGYFGVSQLPIAVPPVGPSTVPEGGTITAPVIGARYWFHRRFGVDLGLGLALSTGSESVNSTSGKVPTSFGLAGHVGLPIAVVAISHYVFEVVPETLVGFTTGTLPGTGTADQSVSGFRFDVGARAGAEIHFGFIGIPELALQGSVGLYFSFQSYRWSQTVNSASVQSDSLATNVGANPWAIFVNNVAALYYF